MNTPSNSHSPDLSTLSNSPNASELLTNSVNASSPPSIWRSPSLLALAFFLPWGVLLTTIARSEWVLNTGDAIKFQTAPIDPLDPLRGRYVSLAFAIEDTPYPLTDKVCPDYQQDTYYATLSKDAQGFARVTQVSILPPTGKVDTHVLKVSGYCTMESKVPNGTAAIDANAINDTALSASQPQIDVEVQPKTSVDAQNTVNDDPNAMNEPNDQPMVHISLPFDRFYANEFDAPIIEKTANASPQDNYLLVKIRGSQAIPEALVIGGVP